MLLSDNVRAKEDIWFIRDTFLKDSIDALFALKKAAIVKKQPKPYIFQFYNISRHYVVMASAIKGIARLLNPLIHGMNEESILPKMVVIVLDVDMLRYMQNNEGTTPVLVIGSSLHYAIKQIDMLIERRKQDLGDKRPGALPSGDSLPKIIWVCMIKRPKQIGKKIYAMRSKFNSILKEHLLDGKADSHHILSIEVPPEEFSLIGELSSSGKAIFWQEVNQGLRKFDCNEITLKPHQYQQQQRKIRKLWKKRVTSPQKCQTQKLSARL